MPMSIKSRLLMRRMRIKILLRIQRVGIRISTKMTNKPPQNMATPINGLIQTMSNSIMVVVLTINNKPITNTKIKTTMTIISKMIMITIKVVAVVMAVLSNTIMGIVINIITMTTNNTNIREMRTTTIIMIIIITVVARRTIRLRMINTTPTAQPKISMARM